MADDNAKKLAETTQRLFGKRSSLESLWQVLAEELYPERADFTAERDIGDDMVSHMFESVPAQTRRDFSGAVGAMMRPSDQKWFTPRALEDERNTDQVVAYLGAAGNIQRQRLYAAQANFSSVMSMMDDDFVTFGNAVASLTERPDRKGHHFEDWHLRDCAWPSTPGPDVRELHRKVRGITLEQKRARFGEGKLTEQEKSLLEKDRFHEVDVHHVVLPADCYDAYDKRAMRGRPFVSIYYDKDSARILEEKGYDYFPYLVRRWKRSRASQYAYSPAALYGLIDARLLQSQARVILEAGEKAVDPPVIARADGVLGTPGLSAGYINWVDAQYDEQLGEALRAFDSRADVRLGLEMKQDTRQVLTAAFMLNKLNLPGEKDMTAFEVDQRIAEYVRAAAPVIEPFIADNQRILDVHFTVLMLTGAFRALGEPPEELQGSETHYEFDTPIHRAYRRQVVMRAKEQIAFAEAFKNVAPNAPDNTDWDKLYRDGQRSIDGEASWVVPVDGVLARREARDQAQQSAEQQKQALEAAKAAPAVTRAMGEIPQARQGLETLFGGYGQGEAPVPILPRGPVGGAPVPGQGAPGPMPGPVPGPVPGMSNAQPV